MAQVELVAAFSGKTGDKLFIDVVNPIGTGRKAKWAVDYNSTLAVDEGEIDVTTDQALVDAIVAGKVTVDYTQVDSVSDNGVKNFLATAGGFVYKNAGEALTAKHVVKLSADKGDAAKVTTEGNEPFGVVAVNANQNAAVRLKVKDMSTVTCIAGATVTAGDKVMAMTNGKVKKATTGKWALGTAITGGAADEDITVRIHIEEIA